MKRYLFLYSLLLVSYSSFAQFVSEGTTVIRSGATFHSENDVQLEQEAILRNKGILSVEKDFNNLGFIQSARSSKINFAGILASTFLPGDANYNTVLIGKFNSDIMLDGNLTIDHRLTFTGSNTRLVLGVSHLTLLDTASILNYDSLNIL